MLRAALVSALFLAACSGAPKPAAAPSSPPLEDHPPVEPAHHGHHGVHGDHDFSDAAAWAEVFDDPARDAWQHPDEVVALLGALPGQIIADVGAGTGYFERYLSRAVGGAGKVYALDNEPAMIAYLNGRAAREAWPNVIAQVVTDADPALPAAGVDRILIVDTWHHLPDRPEYARALAAALRSGGAIAIVDFTADAPLGPPAVARIAPEAVVADLTRAGLTTTIADEHLPHQYVVIGRKTGRR